MLAAQERRAPAPRRVRRGATALAQTRRQGDSMSMMPPRNPAPPRSRDTHPVLSVGRRVFLNCPKGDHRRVTLMDDAGQTTRHTLADGVEVEILAWRPRAPGGARYRIQVMGG